MSEETSVAKLVTFAYRSDMGNQKLAYADSALAMSKLLARYFAGEATVSEIAREAKLSTRSVWRKIKAVDTEGLKGLHRAGRSDKGGRRRLSAELQVVIEGLFLKTPKPTVTWVWEQVVEACTKNKLQAPSYSLVAQVCRQLDRRLKVLAHDSEEAYEKEFDQILRRQAKRPNEMWQADHKELDIWAVDEYGRIGKVWLTAIADDFSRVVMGYFLGIGAANSMRIALAMRQAIWKKDDQRWPVNGIPEILYTDRGRDFKSTHIEQVCIDLKIKVVRTRRKKPRGRGKIERFFRTVDQRFTHKRKNEKTKPLSLSSIESEFHEWLMTEYHQKKHKGIKTSPMEKWNEGKCLSRLPESLDALDLMLHKVGRPRKMWQEGIRLKSRRYSHLLLTQAIGQEFTIRYDPRDLSSIWVYEEEGKLLCKAGSADVLESEMEPGEMIANNARIKKELKKKIKDKNAVADAFVTTKEGRKEAPVLQTTSADNVVKLKLRKHFHEKRIQ
ncbi:MAG: Mu transposase C-terminal domain-containing protein [Chloroflexota bacterium]|uniref:Mu transposase C-terminal domain-containing protein n=3 Tax=Pseudomonadota TaxID=1224 RepID=UPI001588E194|nr:Mu transposase C-terminal domain-containing protein [Klebsiella aerogenes]